MIITTMLMNSTQTGFEGGPQLVLNGFLSGLVGIISTHLLVSKAGIQAKYLNIIYLIIIVASIIILSLGVLQKN